jgi:hypothetical protein
VLGGVGPVRSALAGMTLASRALRRPASSVRDGQVHGVPEKEIAGSYPVRCGAAVEVLSRPPPDMCVTPAPSQPYGRYSGCATLYARRACQESQGRCSRTTLTHQVESPSRSRSPIVPWPRRAGTGRCSMPPGGSTISSTQAMAQQVISLPLFRSLPQRLPWPMPCPPHSAL